MARDVMIFLIRATSISRPMKRVGPENRDFFGPERSEYNLYPKVEILFTWFSAFCYLYSIFYVLFLCSVFCIPRVNQRWHSQLFAKKICSNTDQGVLNSSFWTWNDRIFSKISNFRNLIVSLHRLHETDYHSDIQTILYYMVCCDPAGVFTPLQIRIQVADLKIH